MPKPPLGHIALLAIGATGIASSLIDPPQYDYVNQRPNVTYAEVTNVGTLRDALTDRFVGKPFAGWLNSHLVEAGVVEPVIGALVHGGFYYYTNFFDPAPITSYRGLYTEQSESAISANARSASAFADDLERCGVEFVQILHPPTPSGMDLFADRGPYRASDIESFIAQADDDVQIVDLSDFIREQVRIANEPIYFQYGTHYNRLGADIAAVEISKRLTALGLLPRPLEPGRFTAPHETDRVYDGWPTHLEHIVDDSLFPMLWGAAERPHASYPPIPDGILDQLDIRFTAEGEIFHTSSEVALSDKTALIVGDSFKTALIPYFARMFRETTIYWGADYNADFAISLKPDVVIYNHVGRWMHDERVYVPGPATCPARDPS